MSQFGKQHHNYKRCQAESDLFPMQLLTINIKNKGENSMIKDYLKAGYPALCVLTYEPHRAEQLLPCEGWRFFAWDCIQGIKDLESKKIIEEIRDPVDAVNWF